VNISEGVHFLFQFLIGSLKASQEKELDEEKARFQFLIGSLKAFVVLNELVGLNRFQFLIGSLKASGSFHLSSDLYLVSIPHR